MFKSYDTQKSSTSLVEEVKGEVKTLESTVRKIESDDDTLVSESELSEQSIAVATTV